MLVSWVFLNFATTKWFDRETCFVEIFLLSKSYNVVQTSSEMLSFLHRWKILLKVWVWYRCQKWIERYYHHPGEQSTFYQKVHIKRHRLRKEECFLYCNKFQFMTILKTKTILKTMWHIVNVLLKTNDTFNKKEVDLGES